ncbi:MAG: threonine dehydrogenase-like Zn-dependent dehydrogenase [Cellvibrionaceae bacterium]|jgi:threonine dehydrogenase-like Zn-dependent dehydrogenase
MNALTLKNNQLTLSNIPKPMPTKSEALLRIVLAGICSTDLEIVKGYVPGFNGVLGHEFVGIVEQVGEEGDLKWIGKRVTATINIGCSTCATCLANGSEHCLQRTVLGIHQRDGAFADYLVVPITNLIAIPDSVPDQLAVFTEPLAAALRIREQLCVPPSKPIAVIGPGRLGMLIGWVMSLSGNRVVMLGRRSESLNLAQKWGLESSLIEDIADNAFEFVVETTGNEAGLAHALRITRPRGTIVLKSTYAGPAKVDLTKLVVGEITIVGSRCGPFEPAVRLLTTSKSQQLIDLIDGEFTLVKGVAAMKRAAEPSVRKILLQISHPIV